ncbi:MAG: hypothetical protein AAF718_01790 [Pseudomonadota bacterium]
MRQFFYVLTAALLFVSSAAFSATFNYPIQIDSIGGDGQTQNVGFFSNGSVGDKGTGSARTDVAFPSSTPMSLMDNSLFGASFPGIATAGSQFDNPVVHDAAAGTVTVSGFLGGVTGPYSDFLSAGAFQFVYTGTPGSAFTTVADFQNFLATAAMSGFFAGTFFVSNGTGPDLVFDQRIDFSAVTPIPLPGGALLLLSGLGLFAIRRKA